MSDLKNEIVLGIDLGTTNSCMAYTIGNETKVIPNKVGANTTPSVVGFNSKGEKIVGSHAKRMPGDSIFYETKRLIGRKISEVEELKKHISYKIVKADSSDDAWVEYKGKKYSPSEIGADVLRALKEDAEAYVGQKISKAIVTVPAYFDDAQRQATKDAGKIAGLEVLRIINEPTAAALAYGLDKSENPKKIAVYDLGGGTFDISILEIEGGVIQVLATNGDTQLGGGDFDSKIIEHLFEEYSKQYGAAALNELKADKIALARIKDASEKAKIELTSMQSTIINLEYLAPGPKHLSVEMNRAFLEKICLPLIQKSLEPCKKAMQDAGVSASDLNDIVMVGGMTRMPKVQEIVKDFFRKDNLHKGVNPDEVVAIGAAIQGGILRGDVKNVVLVDVTPLSLGIETEGGVMSAIIERNTSIPIKKSQVYSTAADNQTQVHIRIFQGERPLVNDNKVLGDFVLDGIPPVKRGIPQIEVTLAIDADGILHVTAKDKGTNKEHSIRIQSSGGLSKEEIERMLREAEENAEKDKQKAELVKLKNQADSLINTIEDNLKEHGAKLSESEKKEIEDAVVEFKNISATEDVEILKKAIDDLSKKSMKLGEIVYKESQNKAANDSSSNNNPNE